MRFVDSNIFVYHLADDPKYGERAQEILTRIEGGEKAVTSTLVISQVCSYLKWRKYQEAIPVFINMLRSLPTLAKEDTTFLDISHALTLKEETGASWKKWDDLVIVAQMRRLGVKEIYSRDSDFDALGVKRVF
jgi:predicted nucleic acid-binding protein